MLAQSKLAAPRAACSRHLRPRRRQHRAQQVPAGYPADYQKILDGAKKEGKVIIYSTTDTKAAGPIIKGFEALYPDVKVEYNDMNNTELYNRYISEQAAGGAGSDIVWSSSMDSALKLATDYAMQYKSPEIGKLPAWAVWKDSAYGDLRAGRVHLQQAPDPGRRSAHHARRAGQADRQPAGQVQEQGHHLRHRESAVGFMLAVQDKANDPKYFDTLKDIAKGGLIVQSSTGTMMERVSSGENLIGYNILGSYAETRAKNDPSLGIAYPTDYALVLSRVAFISKKAKNRNAAKLWMDYMLSQKARTSSPTRPTWPRCATTSPATTTSTA